MIYQQHTSFQLLQALQNSAFQYTKNRTEQNRTKVRVSYIKSVQFMGMSGGLTEAIPMPKPSSTDELYNFQHRHTDEHIIQDDTENTHETPDLQSASWWRYNMLPFCIPRPFPKNIYIFI